MSNTGCEEFTPRDDQRDNFKTRSEALKRISAVENCLHKENNPDFHDHYAYLIGLTMPIHFDMKHPEEKEFVAEYAFQVQRILMACLSPEPMPLSRMDQKIQPYEDPNHDTSFDPLNVAETLRQRIEENVLLYGASHNFATKVEIIRDKKRLMWLSGAVNPDVKQTAIEALKKLF